MIGSEGEPATNVPRRREGEAGRRILIVEDNQFVAHQCENALLDAGYAVVATVLNARDAVRTAMDQRPELVLMDIYLPDGGDGIDAALEIQRRLGIGSIFVSAPADTTVKARAESAQPIAWLPKPFSDHKLVATVKAAFSAMDAVRVCKHTQGYSEHECLISLI
jgi:two-component system, response regulator PdtaR